MCFECTFEQHLIKTQQFALTVLALFICSQIPSVRVLCFKGRKHKLLNINFFCLCFFRKLSSS